jgi:hypothetical protein
VLEVRRHRESVGTGTNDSDFATMASARYHIATMHRLVLGWTASEAKDRTNARVPDLASSRAKTVGLILRRF